MAQFEISQRQAAREIEYMRIFFHAPVEYSAQERGYYYSDDSFEFPAPMVSEEEIISLVIAKRLSVTIPDQDRKNRLNAFFENLSAYFGLDLSNLEKKISLKNVRYSRVQPDIFDRVLQGLNQGKKLRILYRSVYTKDSSQRVINPLHLVLYMGNWHIIAFCDMRQGLRDFALSRIHGVEILTEEIPEHLAAIDIKTEIESAHGIFFEGKKEKVVLRFNEHMSDYLREQVWFPGQTLREEPGGGVTLSFYVTDFREVVREVMSFGPEVEVLEPPALKEIIKENITNMSRMYR